MSVLLKGLSNIGLFYDTIFSMVYQGDYFLMKISDTYTETQKKNTAKKKLFFFF